VQLEGRAITTVEGLAAGSTMHPLQTAFAALNAAQCGYCTPGMLLSAKALLDENPRPSRDEIREALAGNLCRCTGYAKIVDAVVLAAERMA
jgi:aerobic carbon-monoxide dehydrogenase small subunit